MVCGAWRQPGSGPVCGAGRAVSGCVAGGALTASVCRACRQPAGRGPGPEPVRGAGLCAGSAASRRVSGGVLTGAVRGRVDVAGSPGRRAWAGPGRFVARDSAQAPDRRAEVRERADMVGEAAGDRAVRRPGVCATTSMPDREAGRGLSASRGLSQGVGRCWLPAVPRDAQEGRAPSRCRGCPAVRPSPCAWTWTEFRAPAAWAGSACCSPPAPLPPGRTPRSPRPRGPGGS